MLKAFNRSTCGFFDPTIPHGGPNPNPRKRRDRRNTENSDFEDLQRMFFQIGLSESPFQGRYDRENPATGKSFTLIFYFNKKLVFSQLRFNYKTFIKVYNRSPLASGSGQNATSRNAMGSDCSNIKSSAWRGNYFSTFPTNVNFCRWRNILRDHFKKTVENQA